MRHPRRSPQFHSLNLGQFRTCGFLSRAFTPKLSVIPLLEPKTNVHPHLRQHYTLSSTARRARRQQIRSTSQPDGQNTRHRRQQRAGPGIQDPATRRSTATKTLLSRGPAQYYSCAYNTRDSLNSASSGLDLLRWQFKEKTLGPCTVVSTDTLLDDNNVLGNTIQIESFKTNDTFVAKVSEVRTWIRRDKSSHGPSAKPDPPLPTIVSPNNRGTEVCFPIEATGLFFTSQNTCSPSPRRTTTSTIPPRPKRESTFCGFCGSRLGRYPGVTSGYSQPRLHRQTSYIRIGQTWTRLPGMG
jgi:hypothetical protein